MTGKGDYFKTFCKVSKAFGTTQGEDELLQLIVSSAVETMDGMASCLFLADEQKDVFVPISQKGLSDDYLHAKPMQARKVVEDVLKGGYFSVYDATTDPRLENHEEKKAEGIASILVVPVLVKDKAIGVLSLYSSTHREFSEEEASFLTALAEQGGMAVERARLFQRLNENSRLFAELASKLNSSLDIKEILHIMSTRIGEALGMSGVGIRLLNKDTGTIDLVASYGLSEEYLRSAPVGAEKAMASVLNGETVVIRDVKTDDRLQYKEEAIREGLAAMLIAPLKSRDEVIGVMRLCSKVPQEFPEDVVQMVNALALQGGLAIQNASMYLMLQEDKKNLEKEIWTHKSWF